MLDQEITARDYQDAVNLNLIPESEPGAYKPLTIRKNEVDYRQIYQISCSDRDFGEKFIDHDPTQFAHHDQQYFEQVLNECGIF